MANTMSPGLDLMLRRIFQTKQQLPTDNVINGNDLPFWAGFQQGYNTMNSILNDIENRKNIKSNNDKLAKDQADLSNPDNYFQNNQSQQNPYSFALGQVPELQPLYKSGNVSFTAGDIPKQNGFGSAFGDASPFGESANGEGQHLAEEGNVSPTLPQMYKMRQYDTAQQPQTQSNPYEQNLDGRYSMNGYVRKLIDNGVNPALALTMYGAFAGPLEQEARNNRIRENFQKLAYRNHGLSEEDLLKTRAQLSYDLMKDYNLEDMSNLTDLLSKQQSGILTPLGLGHDPETLKQVGITINPNVYNALASTIGVNYGNYGNYGGNYNTNTTGGSEYGGNNENARAIYTYLANKGLPDNVIAGIMGNMEHESGFNHDAFNHNDADGTPSGGIIQWHKNRFDNLKNFAGQRGKDWKDLQTQLDFMVDELDSGYPDLLQRMANLTPNEAALLFHKEYERSNDTPEEAAGRGVNATNIFNNRRSRVNYSNQTYTMPTQGANIDEQVKQLKPELQQALPIIGGILKNKFGVNGVISSGARSKEHQMVVNPESPNSYHVYGDAVDIVLPDNTTEEQYQAIKDYFIRTGAFREIDSHDKGTGYHLHLGGYQGGDIAKMINNSGVQPQQPQVQNYQPQQINYFASAFEPRVQGGGGAILNPMVLHKALVEQAERQRLQNNANREFNQKVYDNNRNYELNKEKVNLGKEELELKKQKVKEAERVGKLKDVRIFGYDELTDPNNPIGKIKGVLSAKDKETGESKINRNDLTYSKEELAKYCVDKYNNLIKDGWSEEEAKSILHRELHSAIGGHYSAVSSGNEKAKETFVNDEIGTIVQLTMKYAKTANEIKNKDYLNKAGTYKIQDNYTGIEEAKKISSNAVDNLDFNKAKKEELKRKEEQFKKDKYSDTNRWQEVFDDPNFGVPQGISNEEFNTLKSAGFSDFEIQVVEGLKAMGSPIAYTYDMAVKTRDKKKLYELKNKIQNLKISQEDLPNMRKVLKHPLLYGSPLGVVGKSL